MEKRKIYKYGKGFSFLIIVLALLFIGSGIWIFISYWTRGDGTDLIFSIIGGIFFISFGVVALIDIKRSKLIIENESITTVGVLNNRSLLFSEIKGFRITDKYIYVEPISGKRKPVKISTSYANGDELNYWLATNFTDLDFENYTNEYEEIIGNEEYGWTEEQRNDKLLAAKRLIRILNWLVTIVAIWLIFFPKPALYADLAGVVLGLAPIIAYRMYSGLIRLNEKQSFSPYPSIWWSLTLSSISLAISAGLYTNILYYTNVWVYATAITVVLLGILIFQNKEFTYKKNSHWFLASILGLFLFAYGFGAAVTLNRDLDKSPSRIYLTTISNKRISNGKIDTYYFDLDTWGPNNEQTDVKVDRTLYHSLSAGDSVVVTLRKGELGIPWFFVQGLKSTSIPRYH